MFGQASFQSANIQNAQIGQVMTVSGPSGAPGVLKSTGASGTANPATISISANAGAANSMDIVQISFFDAQTITTVTNGAQTAAVITNYLADASANLPGATFVFTNPPTAARVISIPFGTTPNTGWIIDVETVTNSSAAFGNFYTNGAIAIVGCTGTGNAMSKTVSSAVNELIVGFTTLAYCTTHGAPISATLGGSQTELIKTELGTIDNWQNLVWSAPGSASVSTASQYTADAGAQGASIICIKGF